MVPSPREDAVEDGGDGVRFAEETAGVLKSFVVGVVGVGGTEEVIDEVGFVER